MINVPDRKAATLGQLSIDRARRPAGSHRGRWILLLIVASVAAASAVAAWWYYRTTGVNILSSMTQPPIEVNLVEVPGRVVSGGGGPARVLLVGSGRIVSDRQVNVATKVSGQIVELNVEQGDRVEAGQVLARVEDVVYGAQRDEAAANVSRNLHAVARARAEDARAKATVSQLRAEFEFEQRNYERLKRLFAEGQASDLELNNARNTFEAAEAALQAAVAAADSAGAAVELAVSEHAASEAVLRLLQKRVDDCAIRAPIGGVILERNAQVGDFLAAEGGRGANANAQLVSIADMTLLRVEIDVSERDVQRLRPGQPARITPDADRDHTYDGKVMWLDPISNYAKATVQVKVRILNPGPDLRVEGSAKVEFLETGQPAGAAAEAASSIWLPLSCVRVQAGQESAEVFTVDGDRAVAHPVRIGARTDRTVEILSGITPGARIVADNVERLYADAPVKVLRIVDIDDL